MRVRLDPRWVERLLAFPESGMGYQRVRLRLRDGRTLGPIVVLNGEFLELPDDESRLQASDIVDIDVEISGS